MSKGDSPRPVDKKKYDVNYERVFGKREIKTWTDAPRVAEGSGADSRPSDGMPEKPDERADPKTSETMERTGQGPTCPKCKAEVYRRTGFHFDHEYLCGFCDWVGEF